MIPEDTGPDPDTRPNADETMTLEERATAAAAVIRDVHLDHRWSSNEDRSGSGDCWCDEGLSWETQEDGHADHVAQKIVEALAAADLLTDA